MPSTGRALFYSFLSSNGTTVIAFLGSLVIARLLTPSEIGLYSIAAAFSGFAQILRDFGTSSYLIQCEDPDRETLRSALGGMLLLSWITALLLWAGSEPIAAFYGENDLAALLRLLALNLLLTPLGAITLALLRREMRFGTVGLIAFGAALAQTVCTCILAWYGFGAMSLAWGALANTVVTVLMTLPHRKPGQPWLPGTSRLREVMGFGAYATTASLMGHLNMSASDLLIGKLLGTQAVGLFGRAVGAARLLTTILVRGVSPVVGPFFARLRRGEGDVEQGFCAAASRLTVVAWPALAFMGILADEIIVLLYGPQWSDSAPLVSYLCTSTAIGVPFVVVSQMLMGLGKPELSAKIEAVNLPVKIGLIVLAAPWGLEAVAMAMIAVALAGASYQLWILKRHFDIGVARLFRALGCSGRITMVSAIALVTTSELLRPSLPPPLLIVVVGLVGTVAWALSVFGFRHELRDDVLRFLRPGWRA